MNRVNSSYSALVLVVTGLAVSLIGCSQKRELDPRTQPELVRIVEIGSSSGADPAFTGVVSARVQSNLGFRVPGKITSRLVDTGQFVRAGQPLMTIDRTDYVHAITARAETVAAAKAKAAQAAADEARYRGLVKTGAVSASTYDQIKAASDAAQAELAAAKAQEQVARDEDGYSQLLADADGVVIETLAEPGQVVSAGQTVVKLARSGPREAAVSLPETLRPALGSTASATLYGSTTKVPVRLRERASGDEGRSSMSEHHTSDNNEKLLQEYDISGPQVRERAEKQFLNLSALAVREKAITLFLLITIAAAGVFAFLKLGRAEDPTFTIKVFTVAAVWPGATAQEMQDLVAEPLEKRMQELRDYDRVETLTRPGLALMMVSLKDTTRPEDVSEEFYQARKKLGDEAPKLPQGVFGPFINDQYSDVTFALYSVEAPDLAPRQVAREAETLRQRMLHVPGVKKVDIVGERPERIFVELSYERLATLGVSARDVFDALIRENAVTPSGSIDTRAQQVYIRLDGALDGLRNVLDTI